MNSTELKELAAILPKIADGAAWQFDNQGRAPWRDSHPVDCPIAALRTRCNIRLKPWTLPRHIPGFRPLLENEQWHRDDWKEEWLPAGWRPLLLGERPAPRDQFYIGGDWITQSSYHSDRPIHPSDTHHRTAHPLPDPPDKWAKEKAAHAAGKCVQWRIDSGGVWQDLEPGEVIWSYGEFRIKPEPEWVELDQTDVPLDAWLETPDGERSRIKCTTRSVVAFYPNRAVSYGALFQNNWRIKRPGQSEWQPCRKIAPEKP